MPQILDLGEHGIHELPDDATPDELQAFADGFVKPKETTPPATALPFSFKNPLGIPHNMEEVAMRDYLQYGAVPDGGPGSRNTPLVETIQNALSVSPQTVQDAADVAVEVGRSYIPRVLGGEGTYPNLIEAFSGSGNEMTERVGGRSVTPTTSAKVGAGLQNVGAGVAASFADPVMAALTVAGAGVPRLAPLISAGFGAQMIAHTPEAAQAAGEASVTGDAFERTRAFGNLGLNTVLAPGLMLHGVRPIIPERGPVVPSPEVEAAAIAGNQPVRRLGLPPATAEPFLQPGIPELADAALKEAGQKIVIPGREGEALGNLRRAIEPPQILESPVALAERPGGGEAVGGKVSFASPAEAKAVPSARQSAVKPLPPESEVSNATTQRKIEEGRVGEHPATDARGATTEAGRGDSNVKGAEEASLSVAAESPVKDFLSAFDDPSKKITNDSTAPDAVTTKKTGMALRSVGDLDSMLGMLRQAREKLDGFKKKMKSGEKLTPEEMQQFQNYGFGKIQYPREVIETATNSGSWSEAMQAAKEKPLGERPLDWQKNPEVEAWLRKHGQEIGIELPDIAKAGDSLSVNSSKSKRHEIISNAEKSANSALERNKAIVDHEPAGEHGPDIWNVYSKANGNDAAATISLNSKGIYIVENEHGSTIKWENSLEDAIQEAKQYVESSESQEHFNINQNARDEILNTLYLPRDFSIEDIQDTKWGSVYYKLKKKIGEDADGEPEYETYKVSIRNHEPSPFREREFGRNDAWFEIPKNASLKEISDAVEKVERFAQRKSNEPSLSAKTHVIEEPPTHDAVQSVVKELQSEFPGGLQVEVVKDFHALPDSVHQTAYRQGAKPELVSGAVHGGKVYINSSGLSSLAEARQIFLHEQAGHFATDKILGPKLNKFMQQVHDSFADDALMADTKSRYKNADAVRLGREFVARLSENPKEAPTLWDKVVAKFREWLRNIGWVKKVSENDIRVLLDRATKSLKNVEEGVAEPSLSLNNEKQIPDDAPYQVFDTQTGQVMFEGIYKNRSNIRKGAERRNQNYGKYRYGTRVSPKWMESNHDAKSSSDSLSIKSASDAASERYPAPERQPTAAAPTPTKGQPSASLDDVYRIFEPAPKQGKSLKEKGVNIIESVRTGFSSKFRPVNKLAEDIAKAYGRTSSKDVAGILEQLKGSSGKAEADIYRFDQDVSKLVKGDEKDFNAYMFLRRAKDRLEQDVASGESRRKVANFEIPDIESKLSALESKLGPEKLKQFESAADAYQQHMDEALRLQVQSGRMSPEVYQAIKDGNQFYAPFKVMKYLEESSKPEGSGAKIDTVADYTKAMQGIESPDFRLGDMLSAARQNILMSRVLADKNMAMRHVAELANFDTEGRFIKKLGPDEQPKSGMTAVNVLEWGKQQRYAVNDDVAQAIQLYGPTGGGIISRALSAFSTPFKFGATAANIPFQVSNLLSDVPRQALVSRYGIRSPADLIRYPLDYIQALHSSIAGDVFGKKNKLFLDFLDSGAAGSTVQEYLTPEGLQFKEPTNISRSRKLAQTVLGTLPDFAKAIEQTSKIVGVKRAMRFEGVESGKELARQIPEAITEIRRFSGSPDFGRIGKTVDAARLNLLYMFLNARIQGSIADIGRLAGRDGAADASRMWMRVGAAVGIPTVLAYYLNNSDEYKDDFAKRPQQEKQNYWLIPKDSFITTEGGEKIRDYWRIPKREVSKWFGNAIEAALNWAHERDPEAARRFAQTMLEDISPVNVQGETFKERMESGASSLNPLLKSPLELATGRDLYRHRDLIPDTMKKASPEEQYTQRTAEAFKKLAVMMPDVAPEFMRSPIILENMTRNLTAGLVTQFLPRKPVEGRTSLENQPLLQRFQALPYTDDSAIKEELQQLERVGADEMLKRHRAAMAAIEAGKTNTIQQIVEKLPQKTKEDAALIKHTVDIWLANQAGVTAQERQILALPVRQRAEYVANRLRGLSPEKKSQAILDLSRKRILTESVFQELPNVE